MFVLLHSRQLYRAGIKYNYIVSITPIVEDHPASRFLSTNPDYSLSRMILFIFLVSGIARCDSPHGKPHSGRWQVLARSTGTLLMRLVSVLDFLFVLT